MESANRDIKVCGCLIFLLGSMLCMGVTTFAAEAGRVPYFDFPKVVNDADVVVVGKLASISPPCYMVGLNFYRVEIDEVFKGSFNQNSLLVVVTGVDSSEMRAVLEPEFCYLFSLRVGYRGTEKKCGDFVLFSLFRNWRGVVSLDEGASEHRAVESIEQNFGVSVTSTPSDFLDAVRFAIVEQYAESIVKPEPLSEGGAAIYNALRF